MAVADHGGNGHGIQIPVPEGFNDDGAGALFVILIQLFLGQVPGAGDGTVEIVGMGGAVAGNIPAGLGPGHRVGTVGMDNAPQLGEGLVQLNMGFGIGAGVQGALHHIALQVQDHQHIGCQLLVLHTAGLDDHQTLFPVNTGHIAPGIGDQIPAGELHIGFINLLLQFFQHLRILLVKLRPRSCPQKRKRTSGAGAQNNQIGQK